MTLKTPEDKSQASASLRDPPYLGQVPRKCPVLNYVELRLLGYIQKCFLESQNVKLSPLTEDAWYNMYCPNTRHYTRPLEVLTCKNKTKQNKQELRYKVFIRSKDVADTWYLKNDKPQQLLLWNRRE